MSYTSRYEGVDLTPEEQDIRAALAAYTAHEATDADWVPTMQLARAYRRWLAVHRWRYDPEAHKPLTVRQLGRAIRRLYPHARRCFRRYHAKRCWGYTKLRGPESIRSPWLTRNRGE